MRGVSGHQHNPFAGKFILISSFSSVLMTKNCHLLKLLPLELLVKLMERPKDLHSFTAVTSLSNLK